MALALAVALYLLILETDVPTRKTPKTKTDPSAQQLLATLDPHAAGIDVGAREMWVAVPDGSVPQRTSGRSDDLPSRVRCFGTYTAELRRLAEWLREASVDTVAMEATGVYWIRLHSLGLLSAAFRPDEPIRVWRSYQRHRASLVEDQSRFVLRMQKAPEQMNVKLTQAVSDVPGVTGLAIIEAIVAGVRDPVKLAALRQRGCKRDKAAIAKALEGTWQAEHLFALKQSLETYKHFQAKIGECDRAIEAHLETLALPEAPEPLPAARVRPARKNEVRFDARKALYQMSGLDLTAIEGIGAGTALVLLSEIGTDVSRWRNQKAFGSWLGLAPNPKKSGGKLKSSRTRAGANRAAQALRLAARTLQRSKSALGAFFRRIASRRGVPKAITAAAYKLARIVYGMLKNGQQYAARGQEEYEEEYRERQKRNLAKKASELGYELKEKTQEAAGQA
jgi:transposase